MRSNKYFTSFICVFLLLGLDTAVPAQKIKVKQEQGIEVIYNPDKPIKIPGVADTLILEQDLCLGGDVQDEDYILAEIGSIEVDDQENIIVLDRKINCIKIFDKTGQFIRSFGKKGQGPGELELPVRSYLVGDKLTILDLGNNRISFFTLDGECLQEIELGKYRSSRTMADSLGHIYADIVTYGDTIKNELIKFDTNFTPLETIASIEYAAGFRTINMYPESFNFRFLPHDFFVWGLMSRYELNILGPDGKQIRKIIRKYDGFKITTKNKEEEMDRRFGDREIPEGLNFQFPKHFPAFYYFTCDDSGRIFVRTYSRNDQGWIFIDVFDKEGRYFAKFAHPEDELIYFIKKDKMYCLDQEDEEGFPVIRRYRMLWK
jgi:hypothetical protein